jgi:hypothetical protein
MAVVQIVWMQIASCLNLCLINEHEVPQFKALYNLHAATLPHEA